MLREVLANYGLKSKQIEIYLNLLSSTSKSAQEVADSTGLIRQVVYDNVAELLRLGLISVYSDGRTKKYQANDPDILLSVLDQKKQQVESILPDLKRMSTTDFSKNVVSSVTGLSGVKNLLYSTLNNNTPLYAIVNFKKSHEQLHEHIFYNYTIKRIEKKIPIHVIIEPSKIKSEERSIWKSSIKSIRKTKTNAAVKNIQSMYFLTEGKVLILDFDVTNATGILIENENIYISQKAFFDNLWKEGKAL